MELMNQIDAETIPEPQQGANQLPFLVHIVRSLNATAKSASEAIQSIQPAVLNPTNKKSSASYNLPPRIFL